MGFDVVESFSSPASPPGPPGPHNPDLSRTFSPIPVEHTPLTLSGSSGSSGKLEVSHETVQ
jgi:hypothetical protein